MGEEIVEEMREVGVDVLERGKIRGVFIHCKGGEWDGCRRGGRMGGGRGKGVRKGVSIRSRVRSICMSLYMM